MRSHFKVDIHYDCPAHTSWENREPSTRFSAKILLTSRPATPCHFWQVWTLDRVDAMTATLVAVRHPSQLTMCPKTDETVVERFHSPQKGVSESIKDQRQCKFWQKGISNMILSLPQVTVKWVCGSLSMVGFKGRIYATDKIYDAWWEYQYLNEHDWVWFFCG